MVSESRDPRRITQFLRKCFPGARGATWEEPLRLVALESAIAGQQLPLVEPGVIWHVEGRVENWLQQVLYPDCSNWFKAYAAVTLNVSFSITYI